MSSNTSTKTTYLNRLNAEANMTNQLSSITPDIKEIYESIKQCHPSKFLNSYFHKNVYINTRIILILKFYSLNCYTINTDKQKLSWVFNF